MCRVCVRVTRARTIYFYLTRETHLVASQPLRCVDYPRMRRGRWIAICISGDLKNPSTTCGERLEDLRVKCFTR